MKITAITQELYNKNKEQARKIYKKDQQHTILEKNAYKQIQKYKNYDEIHIYDIFTGEENKRTNNIISINNHINKIGENILILNKRKKLKFYDITTIYQQQKEGKIAVCYGERPPARAENPQHFSAGFSLPTRNNSKTI